MNKLLIAALLAAAPALQAADSYVIDATHTFAVFEWDHFGLSRHTAKFTTVTGPITLDLAGKTGSADITIDVASVNSGVAKLDDHLKSPDFFDVAKFPTIHYKSKAFRFDADRLVAIDGDLTVHGVTKPLTLKVDRFVCKDHPMKKVPSCGADASATIKRTEFGVGTYAPAVSDEINLRLEVEAQKK